MDKFIEFLESIDFKKINKNLFTKLHIFDCGNGVISTVTFKLTLLKKTIVLDVIISNTHELINNVPIYEKIVQDAVLYAYKIDSKITNKYKELVK
ncbi:MAG: hypothetical protein J1F32_01670 [Erysipelotrichales bacterium]|nr:hypothetical protein [Erysipelotrichales bacterium]